MPTASPEISRLSFRADRYDTVLLDGRPLGALYGDDGDERLYLERYPHDESYRIPVLEHLKSFESWMAISVYSESCEYDYSEYPLFLERLKAISGWTPVITANCNSSLGGASTVLLVWAAESAGQVTWSRFVVDSQGEACPAGSPMVAFDKADYLEFIKEAEKRMTVAWLIWRLCGRYAKKCDVAGELEKCDSSVALELLSRLVCSAEHGRYLASLISPVKRPWIMDIVRLLSHPLIHIILAGCLIGALFHAAVQMDRGFNVSACLMAVIFAVNGINGLMQARYSRKYAEWEPLVYMSSEGFLVGWDKELIPWSALSGYEAEAGEGAAPAAENITIEADGQVKFMSKFLDGSGQIDPDLTAIQAGLTTLIKEHGRGNDIFCRRDAENS
ncbi:MAG: hypothetical protein LBV79_06340 [Candidatus Adiutrix sp.]|jgi:hypothetical protein|nr:hypothetical protein [Candidatus Adiutrix sp.]